MEKKVLNREVNDLRKKNICLRKYEISDETISSVLSLKTLWSMAYTVCQLANRVVLLTVLCRCVRGSYHDLLVDFSSVVACYRRIS